MTKAQIIRRKRLKKREDELTIQAERIFDWILDIIDEKLEIGYYGPTEVCLFDEGSEIQNISLKGPKYNIVEPLLKFDRIEIFSKLKEIVEQEEGYKAELNTEAIFWERKAIRFKVVIE